MQYRLIMLKTPGVRSKPTFKFHARTISAESVLAVSGN